MLVLSRKVGERIVINENITLVVNRVAGNRVSLGIEAPEDVQIVRGELQAIRDGFDKDASVPRKCADGGTGYDVAHPCFSRCAT